MVEQTKRRLWQVLRVMMLLLLALMVSPTVVQAQENCRQCHGDVNSKLEGSVHGMISCVGCHADIEGYPHPEGASLDKKESVAACSTCHEGWITDSYEESYHGKAVNLGSKRSAACADCHGAHDILGADHPDSRVSKANTPETCASCHGQASPGFAEGKDHFMLTSTGPGAPMYYTAKFFVWLTLITITALVIHIELQLYHNLRTILRERKRGE